MNHGDTHATHNTDVNVYEKIDDGEINATAHKPTHADQDCSELHIIITRLSFSCYLELKSTESREFDKQARSQAGKLTFKQADR